MQHRPTRCLVCWMIVFVNMGMYFVDMQIDVRDISGETYASYNVSPFVGT